MSIGANDGNPVALNPTVDFIAGTIAGMASLVVGFPLDTVKVRFQSPTMAHRYKSTFNAVTTIVREERFIGLYKGITYPLATVALMNGLVFSSYRFFMKLQLENSESIPTLTQIALAGAGSGIVSSIVTTPTELIKIRQQSLLIPTTARQVAAQIFRDSGVRGLYRGITATALRDCGYGAYFFAVSIPPLLRILITWIESPFDSVLHSFDRFLISDFGCLQYEATCRFLSEPVQPAMNPTLVASKQDSNNLSWTALMVAGGVAGVIGWLATFPLDVVKTRVQGSEGFSGAPPNPGTHLLNDAHTNTIPNPYRTTLSTIIHSYRNEGIGVFFHGLTPTLIRAIPVNMVTFATFEAVVHFLS
ncbi:carnitine/acyl carnitine carrier [Pluteus cervinus]|uniref:Carnitine/acyl carnitine carrier n=1 Tax=Pluteus cervinus TaxID=181527 RepID=A0ACD3B7A6_9AGAR|nr:carnitine/acyl carnitine carrier [Pluteus cervinus]